MGTSKFSPIEPRSEVPFGQGKVRALKSWSDGYSKIQQIEDDGCYVYLLENSKGVNFMKWIPKVIING